MRTASKPIWAGGIGAVGLLAGVITLVGASPGTAPPAAATELTPFDDCEQLRSWYVKTALPHVTAWGWDSDEPYPIYFAAAAGARDLAAPSGETDAVGNGETGTNLQEQGVDEPDLAKTDGELIALIRHGDLIVLDASGETPREIGRLDVPNRQHISELLLVGDRALLLGSRSGVTPYLTIPREGDVGPSTTPRTTITTVDLSDPSSPSVQHTETVQGELVSAREHDGTVRIVMTSLPDLDFVQPFSGLTPKQALAANREIVRHSSVEHWLPGSRVDGGAEQPLLACADVRHPEKRAGFGAISVLTMDPDRPEDRAATAVAADGDLVHASTDRLYVATTDDGWSDWTWRGVDSAEPPTTDIHAFAVTDDETTYVSSGQVAGRVKDRWAFSEHEGLLRVASTVGPDWSPKETRVTVLEEQGGTLEPIGSVGGMGENEQVEAVRWFGDLAIVVTFRQVDPLYTLDLSDSTDPTVVGELKIPGFSAYLHPLGDDLILGVGQDATKRGSLRGSQVSTFDLGDLTTPQRLDLLGFGIGGQSPVEYDSRAFSYLPDERLAFVPTSGYRNSTMEVVSIGDDGGLTTVAALDLPGWSSGGARTLPLDDGRVAIVASGDVVRVVDPATL